MTEPSLTRTSALRPRLGLDGEWDFDFEGTNARRSRAKTTSSASPGLWQTQFPALRNAQGLGRYRKPVELPPDWTGRRIVLVMEGVFHAP